MFNSFTQLEYTVACFLFVEGEYALAHQHFRRTQELQSRCKGHCRVEGGKLAGFLMACEGVLGGEVEGRREEEEGLSPANALELHLQARDYEVSIRGHVKCPNELQLYSGH